MREFSDLESILRGVFQRAGIWEVVASSHDGFLRRLEPSGCVSMVAHEVMSKGFTAQTGTQDEDVRRIHAKSGVPLLAE